MTAFNWLDYVILAIFIFSALSGFARGLIGEIVSLASWVAAFIVASTFAKPLADSFMASPRIQGFLSQLSSSSGIDTTEPANYLALGISFALLFAATLIVGAILSYFISFSFQTGILGIGNRLLGAIFGLVRGFIINLVLIFLIQLTPLSAESWWQSSYFVVRYQPAVQWLGTMVSPALANLKERVGHTLENINTQMPSVPKGYNPFSR